VRTLILLRHAKSDWQHEGLSDIQRPLNSRGHKDALTIGKWMAEHHLTPEWVLCSTAQRTRETLAQLNKSLTIPESLIQFEERLYQASLEQLLQLLDQCPQDLDQILLIGHNPGVEQLLGYLCGNTVPLSSSGKLMSTATLAQVALPDDWKQLPEGCGKLLDIIRPKELQNP